MPRVILLVIAATLSGAPAWAQDAGGTTPDEPVVADESATGAAEQVAAAGSTPDQPKAMSGMSILGNEEAPKALVIVPWKASRLGDEPGLNGTLDERARPVDRDVFLRELSYHEIRAGKR